MFAKFSRDVEEAGEIGSGLGWFGAEERGRGCPSVFV